MRHTSAQGHSRAYKRQLRHKTSSGDGGWHLDKLNIGFGELLCEALTLLDRLHEELDAVQVGHGQLPIDVVVGMLLKGPRVPRRRQQDDPQEVLETCRILVACSKPDILSGAPLPRSLSPVPLTHSGNLSMSKCSVRVRQQVSLQLCQCVPVCASVCQCVPMCAYVFAAHEACKDTSLRHTRRATTGITELATTNEGHQAWQRHAETCHQETGSMPPRAQERQRTVYGTARRLPWTSP